MDSQELIDFESDIAQRFNNAEIPYPIHLSGGNEDQLIKIFTQGQRPFKMGDWCFSTWRNHYHALLAGIPKEEVKRQIMAGRSMTVCSPEHNFFSSAIVGGCIPIALGVAWEIKRRGGDEQVWLFLGDMAAMSGMAFECGNYANWNNLPLYIVVEDNGKSVCTTTKDAWGIAYKDNPYRHMYTNDDYQFELPWPHAGAGHRVQF